MSILTQYMRWLRLKRYQFEVTFCAYMFTPYEKFFFWSLIFLLTSLCFIAITFYLPQHIAFLLNRAWFYIHGESVDVIGITKEGLAAAASTFADEAASTTTDLMREAVLGRAEL